MLNRALQMGTFVVCTSGQKAVHVVLQQRPGAHRSHDAALPLTGGGEKKSTLSGSCCAPASARRWKR